MQVDASWMAGLDAEDSEYEYEYDETETETFYINIDITSCNGPIRPPRRRQPNSTTAASPQDPSSVADTPEFLEGSEPIPATIDHAGPVFPEERFQLLDLHSANPLVSYQNHVFSCSWADMIGTELLFTKPDPHMGQGDSEFLKHGNDFDLIAANSVKIIGRKAHLIAGSGFIEDNATHHSLTDATIHQHLQAVPALQTQPVKRTSQVRFLRRLANVKQAKGESDTVRTIYSVRRGQSSEDRLRGWARTEERLARIQRLSQDAIQGSLDAIRELEMIYAEVEAAEVAAAESSYTVTDSAAGSSSQFGQPDT